MLISIFVSLSFGTQYLDYGTYGCSISNLPSVLDECFSSEDSSLEGCCIQRTQQVISITQTHETIRYHSNPIIHLAIPQLSKVSDTARCSYIHMSKSSRCLSTPRKRSSRPSRVYPWSLSHQSSVHSQILKHDRIINSILTTHIPIAHPSFTCNYLSSSSKLCWGNSEAQYNIRCKIITPISSSSDLEAYGAHPTPVSMFSCPLSGISDFYHAIPKLLPLDIHPSFVGSTTNSTRQEDGLGLGEIVWTVISVRTHDSRLSQYKALTTSALEVRTY